MYFLFIWLWIAIFVSRHERNDDTMPKFDNTNPYVICRVFYMG